MRLVSTFLALYISPYLTYGTFSISPIGVILIE